MVNLFALGLTLATLQSVQPQKGKFDDSQAKNPSFKSVGVRGTIDGGGYAASAETKAQTEFYEQLADLQVVLLHTCSYNDSERTAAACIARGDFVTAVASLESEVRANPKPAARELLGLAYEATGQLTAASEQFRLATIALSGDSAAATAFAIALLFQGDSNGAAKAPGASPLSIGAALFQEGHVSEAIEQFLKSASERPADVAPFGFIATSVRAADPATLKRTIAALVTLAERWPASGGIQYALGCATWAEDQSQTAESEAHLKLAVKLTPNLADAHFRLGVIYAERQELPAAIAEYESAIHDNDRLIECHYRLGQLYNRAGEVERAKKELDLYRQVSARRKTEIESGRVPIHLSLCR
jgi:tetratricopeptide (TPR) repeat protein